jgi:hypothetical protein
VYKQRNTAEMTALVGKRCIRRSSVGKVGRGENLIVTDALRTSEDTEPCIHR